MTKPIDTLHETPTEVFYSDKSRGLPKEFSCGSGKYTFYSDEIHQRLLKQGYVLGREYDIYNEDAGERVRDESNVRAVATLDSIYGKGNWSLAQVKSSSSKELGYQVIFK